MRKKRIFIGSSSEELDLANAAKAILEFEKNFDDRYFIVKEKDDIANNLIKTMSKLVENLEYKIEIDNNLEKSFK